MSGKVTARRFWDHAHSSEFVAEFESLTFIVTAFPIVVLWL